MLISSFYSSNSRRVIVIAEDLFGNCANTRIYRHILVFWTSFWLRRHNNTSGQHFRHWKKLVNGTGRRRTREEGISREIVKIIWVSTCFRAPLFATARVNLFECVARRSSAILSYRPYTVGQRKREKTPAGCRQFCHEARQSGLVPFTLLRICIAFA